METREMILKQGEGARRSSGAVVLLMVSVVAMLLSVGSAANATEAAPPTKVTSSRLHSSEKTDHLYSASANEPCTPGTGDAGAQGYLLEMSGGEGECEPNDLSLGNNEAVFTRGDGSVWPRNSRFDEWINTGFYPFYIKAIFRDRNGNMIKQYRFTQPEVTKVEYAGDNTQRVTFSFYSLTVE